MTDEHFRLDTEKDGTVTRIESLGEVEQLRQQVAALQDQLALAQSDTSVKHKYRADVLESQVTALQMKHAESALQACQFNTDLKLMTAERDEALRNEQSSATAYAEARAEAERLREALSKLMEAHRIVFKSSLHTAFQAGKSTFHEAWKACEAALTESPPAPDALTKEEAARKETQR